MNKKHSNFFTFIAKDNFELGSLLGKQFGGFAKSKIEENSQKEDWPIRLKRAGKYLEVTEKYFPEYVAELRGYAEGANVDWESLWTLSLEEETTNEHLAKCTTMATNSGRLVSHNEDWEKGAADTLCLLLKKVGGVAIFELYYQNTLGGNAVSLNSHGFIISINSLTHDGVKFGIPRNVIARAMSETADPENDFEKLKDLPRGLGLNFNILNRSGQIWNIECSSRDATLVKPFSPYIHTNHYLGKLKSIEKSDNWDGTLDRYEVAQSKIKEKMSTQELLDLAGDQSRGEKVSILNERTIGRMIIDQDNSVAKVWLKREEEKGWIDYELDKILRW